MKKYLVEFVGTFFLVLTVGLAVRSGSDLAPLAIGSVLACMIFAGGYVSGGHYNPAVSLGVLLRGKLDKKDFVPYVVAQLIGAVVAWFVVSTLVGAPPAGPAGREVVPSLISEFVFTFALVWVVLSAATSKGNAGNSFFGLAIGFTLFVGVVAIGGISGGALNPAVGLGVVLMGMENLSQLWVYLGAQVLGGIVAAMVFKVQDSGSQAEVVAG
ncbi:MAG TPA: MIP/aquaporin family protein [Opitutaceae bacterium]|nr:MIP/aquaporin family protein [Opitutaceae bacterium]